MISKITLNLTQSSGNRLVQGFSNVEPGGFLVKMALACHLQQLSFGFLVSFMTRSAGCYLVLVVFQGRKEISYGSAL